VLALFCSARVCLGPRRSLPKGFQNDHSASRVGQRVKGFCALKSGGFWNAENGPAKARERICGVRRTHELVSPGAGLFGACRDEIDASIDQLPRETGPDPPALSMRTIAPPFARRSGEVRARQQRLGRWVGGAAMKYGARPQCESNAATPQPTSHP